MVRIGIIGFGFMGQTHFRCYGALENAARVIAVADENTRRAHGDISDTWGNLSGTAPQVDFSSIVSTTNWRDLIALQDVDAVDVCVPTPQHPEIVKAALAAGKHVLCEKPLARNLESAQEIARAAAEVPAFLMPAMCMRFWPEWAWLKEAIADQRFGKVLGASFLRQGTLPPGWYRNGEMSGGALLDLHIHDTDFVSYLFGTPKAVSSRGYRSRSGEIDYVSTQYLYDNVPLVIAEGGLSFAEPFPFRMRYTVNFESGTTADFDLSRPEPLIAYADGKATPIVCERIDGWFGEIRYFVDCIAKGRRPTVVTAGDAVQSIRIVEAEGRSIARGAVEVV